MLDAGTTILAHTKRTALGMADFVARQDGAGGLELTSVDELRRYAYVVGIVGELLTDLFVLAHPRIPSARVDLLGRPLATG